MKNPNIEFNPEGVASLNELLEARELTGQMPKTMPTGIRVKNRENTANDCYCNDNCNCDCNCEGTSDPDCDCDCVCGDQCDCYTD